MDDPTQTFDAQSGNPVPMNSPAQPLSTTFDVNPVFAQKCFWVSLGILAGLGIAYAFSKVHKSGKY